MLTNEARWLNILSSDTQDSTCRMHKTVGHKCYERGWKRTMELGGALSRNCSLCHAVPDGVGLQITSVHVWMWHSDGQVNMYRSALPFSLSCNTYVNKHPARWVREWIGALVKPCRKTGWRWGTNRRSLAMHERGQSWIRPILSHSAKHQRWRIKHIAHYSWKKSCILSGT